MPNDDATLATSRPPIAPEEVVVTIDGKTRHIKYVPGDTLLETVVRNGVAAPFSCLEGNCGTCMVRRVKGEVALRANYVLTDADLANGYTLACQGVPTDSVCEIEFLGREIMSLAVSPLPLPVKTRGGVDR